MRRFIETLERRQLFAGAIDATFGSATGANFDAPGVAPFLLDSAVDPAGRVVLAGMTSDAGGINKRMFIARLHVNGQLDDNFGGDGIIDGTPRGLQRVDYITPLGAGGYLVAGSVSDNLAEGTRYMRLRPNGSVDTSFGRNGVLRLAYTPMQILEQPDGGILLFAHGAYPDPLFPDEERINFIIRLHARGSIDRSFGDDGFVQVREHAITDQLSSREFDITSASLAGDGRILVAVTGRTTSFGSEGEVLGGSTTLYVQRFNADGTRDTGFGDSANDNRATLYTDSWGSPDDGEKPSRSAIARTRPDGKIVVLQSEGANAAPHTLTLLSGSGTQPQNVDFATLAPGFTVKGLPGVATSAVGHGPLTVLNDHSLIVAGTIQDGQEVSPALLRIKPDLTLDTTFGPGGVMTLSNSGNHNDANGVMVNQDGTLTVVSSLVEEAYARGGDVRVARLFVDDRPVVSLQRVRRDDNNLRITVSIRGANAIDAATLDDNDLRLQDSTGNRTKLRLVSSSTSNGAITATYRVNFKLLPDGIYSLRAIAGEIEDVQNNANAPRGIGTVVDFSPNVVGDNGPVMAPFNIDVSFGVGGMVTLTPTEIASAQDVVVQEDGKIVVVAWTGANDLETNADSITLARLNPDGSIDPTFGAGGLRTVPVTSGQHGERMPLLLASDGSFFVGGVGVRKFTSAGAAVSSFGTSGVALAGQPVHDLVEVSGGKILVLDSGLPIRRLNADGSLDTSFGSSGISNPRDVVSPRFVASGRIVVDPDGRIIAAGTWHGESFGDWKYFVARVNADGSMDSSFGDGGFVITDSPVPGDNIQANAVALQSDGKIVVAGGGSDGTSMARYLSDGSLDPSFGTNGLVATDPDSVGEYVQEMAITSSGKILVVGHGSDLISVHRYNADGSRDTTFAAAGSAITRAVHGGPDNPSQGGYGLALQEDGKIVVAAQVELQNAGGRASYYDISDLFVIRLHG